MNRKLRFNTLSDYVRRTHAQFLHQLHRLGWPGGLGAFLLFAAVLADLFWLTPLEQQVAAIQRDAVRHALLPPVRRANAPRPVAQQEAEVVLARLFAAARQAGLRLDEGRYQQGREAGGRRLRIDLPLQGEYPALRRFIAQALNENPALVLERMTLRRDTIETTQLDARFSLLLSLSSAR